MRNQQVERPVENPSSDMIDPFNVRAIDTILNAHGISKIEEDVTDPLQLSLPVVPKSPRVRNPEEFIQEHKRLLDDLGIEHDTQVFTEKRKIQFFEKGKEQELNLFTYEPNLEEDKSLKPIILFSHGGGIGGSSNEKSAYLRVLYEVGLNNSFLVAPDHRGSSSHLEKTRYSLADRNTDMLLALRYSLSKYEDHWNGQIYLFGDSMGGHVSSVVAGILASNQEFKDSISLILTEPATYIKEADTALWTNFVKGSSNLKNILNTKEIEGLEEIEIGQILQYNEEGENYYIKLHKIEDGERVFKISPIISALEDGSSFSEVIRKGKPSKKTDTYALEAIKEIDRILLIQMVKDEIVTGDIRLLFEKALEDKPESKMVNIPAGHQTTHVKEVKAIIDFIND
jgi:acetyl esterase/lipase